MSSRSLTLIAAVAALALVALAAVLLPRPRLRTGTVVDAAAGDAAAVGPPREAPPTRHAYVPGVISADTILVADGSAVTVGDTLAFRQNDPYVLLREDLRALSAEELSPAEALATLEQIGRATPATESLPTFLAELQDRILRKGGTPARGAAGPPVDRDLLSADLMGAEDALDDLRAQLRFVSPATSPDLRQQAAAIREAIAAKEAFVSRTRTRLATADRRARGPWRLTPPKLTAAQRDRIDNYAAALGADTTYVLSPATGTFRVSTRGAAARVEWQAALADLGPARTTPFPGTEERERALRQTRRELHPGSYELHPVGLPALWGTAERRDSVRLNSGRARVVVPD